MPDQPREVDTLYPLDPEARTMTRNELAERRRQFDDLNRLRWVTDRDTAQKLFELHRARLSREVGARG